MNRVIQTFFAGIAFASVVGGGVARAQVEEPITFKTNFPFMVGHTILPADAYRIEPVENDPLMLHIESLKRGKAGAFVQVENAIAPEQMKKTEVVFKRYGDQYVLKTIWLEGESVGATVLMTRAEERHAKDAAPTTDHHVPASRSKATTRGTK